MRKQELTQQNILMIIFEITATPESPLSNILAMTGKIHNKTLQDTPG